MFHAFFKFIFRFRSANNASAAIEFALIAPIFLALLLGLIQVGLNYVVQSTVDRLANSAALYIRSGVPQIANMNGSTFKSQILCSVASPILNCNKILYRIWTNNNPRALGAWIFSSSGFAIPWCTTNVLNYYTQSGGITYCNQPSLSTQLYCPGAPSTNIMVQIAYPIPFFNFVASSNVYFLSTQITVNYDYGVSYINPSGC